MTNKSDRAREGLAMFIFLAVTITCYVLIALIPNEAKDTAFATAHNMALGVWGAFFLFFLPVRLFADLRFFHPMPNKLLYLALIGGVSYVWFNAFSQNILYRWPPKHLVSVFLPDTIFLSRGAVDVQSVMLALLLAILALISILGAAFWGDQMMIAQDPRLRKLA